MNIASIKSAAFVVALTGLIVLLWTNVALLLGKSAPVDLSFANIFMVLFPLWAFTIYYLKQSPPLEEAVSTTMPPFQKLRHTLGNPPAWAMVVLVISYGYSLYHIFLFLNGGMVDPQYVNGQYQIKNHGQVTIYSEAEYHVLHFRHLRMITGFFLAFFAVSVVVLAPWRRISDR